MVSTGAGLLRAGRTTRALLETLRVRVLLGIGVCGALTPGLPRGTVVVGEEIWSPSGRGPGPDPAWLFLAHRLPSVQGAVLLSSPGIVGTKERKAELLRRLPREPLAAVDMESFAWVRAAEDKEVPHLVLRSVFDPAEEDLPPFLERCHDEDGTLMPGRLLREVLLHPGIVPVLFSLRRRVQECAEALAETVLAMLDSVEPPSRGGR
jgi:adenosylhomocysteine nucleosidase